MDTFLVLVQITIIFTVVLLLLFIAMKIKRILSSNEEAEDNSDRHED